MARLSPLRLSLLALALACLVVDNAQARRRRAVGRSCASQVRQQALALVNDSAELISVRGKNGKSKDVILSIHVKCTTNDRALIFTAKCSRKGRLNFLSSQNVVYLPMVPTCELAGSAGQLVPSVQCGEI